MAAINFAEITFCCLKKETISNLNVYYQSEVRSKDAMAFLIQLRVHKTVTRKYHCIVIQCMLIFDQNSI